MWLYETIKRERDLLKVNQNKEDAKYWALKKEVNDMEIRFAALQQNKEKLQWKVQV
jgi:5-formyltetrahydrofolate cyclo-ligase